VGRRGRSSRSGLAVRTGGGEGARGAHGWRMRDVRRRSPHSFQLWGGLASGGARDADAGAMKTWPNPT
jgi:hypothetical protein